MKPAKFEYVAPATLDAAVAALAAANGEGKLLAGGQSLLPLLNFRMTRPAVLVDLNGIKELSFIELRGDSVAIGALTRHREIERSPLIASRLPVMSAAMQHVAHLAIRNRGTIGGSLSHADPAAELPMMAMFYGASLMVQGLAGRRAIAAKDFFVDALTNCLEPEDIVVEIEFPILPTAGRSKKWPDASAILRSRASRYLSDAAHPGSKTRASQSWVWPIHRSGSKMSRSSSVKSRSATARPGGSPNW
jgi:aerobic carbon-monoxide dehydrogenase medium subunit